MICQPPLTRSTDASLFEIVETIVVEDEQLLVQFLMGGTVIDTRINGTTTSKPFTSNVGTSQGDSLSLVLFTVYLEYALNKVQLTLPRTTSSFEAEIPNEVAYTDSVDFIRKNYADIKEIQFQDHLLKVNTDKTEYSEEGWKEVKKKVGSLIDDDKDVKRRKQLATVALNK